MAGGCDHPQQQHTQSDDRDRRGDDRTRAGPGWHFVSTDDWPEDIIYTEEGGNASGSDGEGQRLRIVILVVGTLGDVLPFIQIGRRLQSDGHSVRLATHLTLRPVVEKGGLDFYSLGGDPEALCDYLCRNQGTLPSRGDAGQLLDDYENMRAMVEEMAMSTWHACTAPWPPCPHLSPAPPLAGPVDAIIANLLVPSALHCASRLDCHLHFMFPQPWAASSYLSHPLWGRGLDLPAAPSLFNLATHVLLDELHHLAWRHAIDRLRDSIGLPRLYSADFGAHLHRYHQVPLSVLCSPRLLPRPPDWGPHTRITGAITLATPTSQQHGEEVLMGTTGEGEDAHRRHGLGNRSRSEKGLEATQTSLDEDMASLPTAASTPSSSPPVSPPPSSPLPSTTADVPVPPPSDCGLLPPWLQTWMVAEDEGPLVLVCFGSMVVHDWPKVIAILRDAAAMASVRVLLHRPSARKFGRGDGPMSSRHLVVLEGRLPHAMLLPYCAAMLHHGGAGTTYTTLQAGKPSMAMPFFGDQFLWADVLRREGVAPGPPYMPLPLMGTRAGGRGYPLLSSVNTGFTGHLQVAGMEVDTMAWVLREVVKEQYRQRAVELAQELRQDGNGVEQAVDHFYQHYHKSSNSQQERVQRRLSRVWRYGPMQARTLWEALAQAGRGLVEDTLRAGVKILMVPVGGWMEAGAVGMIRGLGMGLSEGVLLVVRAVGDAVHRILRARGWQI